MVIPGVCIVELDDYPDTYFSIYVYAGDSDTWIEISLPCDLNALAKVERRFKRSHSVDNKKNGFYNCC